MKTCKPIFLLAACLLAGLLAGCGSVPLGSLNDDLRAKNSAAHPDKSRIYVYRHETIGFAVPMTVTVDGRAAGRTAGQTYLMLEVEPGTHALASHAEDRSTLNVQTEAGRTYYVWQEVKIGFWKARSRLHAVDETTGRKAVAECNLGEVAAPLKTAMREMP
jgi:hypothetical protein